MSNKAQIEKLKQLERREVLPRLRFPEFHDAGGWLREELGVVAEFVSERMPLAQLNLTSYVSTENFLAHYGGVIAASKLPSSGSATRFKKNDVLVSNIRPYLKKVWFASNDGGASNDVIVIRAKSELREPFLSYILKNDAFIDYVMRGAKGVKMPRGDIPLMMEYPIAYPSFQEQRKIADCLSSIDDLISAEAKKLDALKTHKKGLMQSLFPAEGETVPKLRFPEFQDAGEWEEHHLGTLADKVGSGITPTGGDKNYLSEGRPFVRSQNVGWGELILNDVAFIDDETHQSFDSTEIRLYDVLLNITGASIGRSAVADSRVVGGNVNQHVCIIRVKTDLLNHFLLNQFLISERGQKQIDSFQAGGNRQGLNFSQIRSFEIPLPPTKDEQRKIGNCLAAHDDFIATQTEMLAQLKAHKKGLMQQLFPVLDEAQA